MRQAATLNPVLMLICNHCGTAIPDSARFCPACGDPVTAGDRAKNQVSHETESVRLLCPHCEQQALYEIPAHGVAAITCTACVKTFDTRVVRIRSKRSAGQKQYDTRSFTVRVETLDGRDDLLEFERPLNEDFELRSKDLAAFSSIDGVLIIVQNLSVGRHMDLNEPDVLAEPAPQVQSGCLGAVLLLLGAAATSALAF